MPAPTAVLLLAHGSPDPDWRRPVEQLRARLQRQRPEQVIREVYLGHGDLSLIELVDALACDGHRHLWILPVFLSPGGRHIKEDIPQRVAQAARRHPELTLELQPGALGAEPEVIEALAMAASRLLDAADPA